MPPGSDAEAFQALRERRQQLLKQTFDGTKLKFKGSALATILSLVGNDVRALKSDIGTAQGGTLSGPSSAKPAPLKISGSAPKIPDNVRSLMGDVLGNTSFPDAFNTAASGVNGVIEKVNDVLEVLPPLALISSAAQALWNFGKAAKSQWDKYSTESNAYAARFGDPRAAVMAMAEVLARLRNEQITKGSINLTHAAVSAGGFFGGVGALTGPIAKAVKGAATLLHRSYLLARDVRMLYQANKALQNPARIDRKLFVTAPMLGCYLLTEVETSALVNLLIGEIGGAGWMDKVEKLNKPLTELRSKAGQLIRDGRFDLQNLKTNKWSKEGLSTFQQLKARFGFNYLKK